MEVISPNIGTLAIYPSEGEDPTEHIFWYQGQYCDIQIFSKADPNMALIYQDRVFMGCIDPRVVGVTDVKVDIKPSFSEDEASGWPILQCGKNDIIFGYYSYDPTSSASPSLYRREKFIMDQIDTLRNTWQSWKHDVPFLVARKYCAILYMRKIEIEAISKASMEDQMLFRYIRSLSFLRPWNPKRSDTFQISPRLVVMERGTGGKILASLECAVGFSGEALENVDTSSLDCITSQDLLEPPETRPALQLNRVVVALLDNEEIISVAHSDSTSEETRSETDSNISQQIQSTSHLLSDSGKIRVDCQFEEGINIQYIAALQSAYWDPDSDDAKNNPFAGEAVDGNFSGQHTIFGYRVPFTLGAGAPESFDGGDAVKLCMRLVTRSISPATKEGPSTAD